MCTGLEIAALAASAAGSAVNSRIQNQAIDESNRQNQIAMQEEGRQRGLETDRQRQFEADQAAQVTRALFDAAPEKIVEKADEAAIDTSNPINAAADTYNTPTLTGQVQNEDVNESIGATIASATSRTREMLRNAAILSGQSTGMNDASQSLGRMGSEIQTIGSNRRGSGNVANMETRVPAAQVTASTSPVGDLLMLAGQGVGGYAGKATGLAGGNRPFDIGSIFSARKSAPLSAISWL